MNEAKILIDGKWIASSETFESVNPATGNAVGLVHKATNDHIQEAVTAAKRAEVSWRALDLDRRCKILKEAVARIRSAYGEAGKATPIKELIVQEVGKRLPEADVEVIESSDMIEYFADEAPRLLGERSLALDSKLWPSKRSSLTLEPVGTVAVIKPWNYPLEIPVWSIAAALVAGNTVIFKPSEHSCLIGAWLARVLLDAGVPPGVIGFLPGDKATGAALVSASGIDMVSFTGSVSAGRAIALECAQRHRRCALELGGNDPALVLADADLELAVNGLVWGSFANAGQVCVRPKRIYLESAIADDFIDAFVEMSSGLRVDVDYGPMISLDQRNLAEDHVSDCLSKGASLLTGGHSAGTIGFYYEPTVLSGVTEDMRPIQEECFGPVAPLLRFATVDEGIARANASLYGLGASVWTSDLARGQDIAARLQSGMVWINDVNVAFPQAPWGGVKQSGPGVDLGEWGLNEYVRPKHICVETSVAVRRDWWFPYSH